MSAAAASRRRERERAQAEAAAAAVAALDAGDPAADDLAFFIRPGQQQRQQQQRCGVVVQRSLACLTHALKLGVRCQIGKEVN